MPEHRARSAQRGLGAVRSRFSGGSQGGRGEFALHRRAATELSFVGLGRVASCVEPEHRARSAQRGLGAVRSRFSGGSQGGRGEFPGCCVASARVRCISPPVQGLLSPSLRGSTRTPWTAPARVR